PDAHAAGRHGADLGRVPADLNGAGRVGHGSAPDRPAAAQHRAAARLETAAAGLRLVALDAGQLRAAGAVALVVGAGPVLGPVHRVADAIGGVGAGQVGPRAGELHGVGAGVLAVGGAGRAGSPGLADVLRADPGEAVDRLAGLHRGVVVA